MKFNNKTKQELIDLLLELEEENTILRSLGDEVSALEIKNSCGVDPIDINRNKIVLENLAHKLKKTENNYKFLIENINDIVYEYDSSGILKYISPVVEKTFGFTADDILGKNFIQFVGGDEEYAAKVLADLRDKKEIHTEYRIPTKTGDIRWANLSTKAVFEGDAFMGGAGTVTDITERKHFELELKRSELLYRSILDASPDPITITDLEGKILLTSNSVEKIFGFDASLDFANHSILEFIAEQDHDKALNAMMRMFQNEFPGAEEYKGVKGDGSTFDIEVNGEFIRDDAGQPVNLIFVTRDITQRKQTNAKLKEAQESYRNLVENVNDVIYDLDKNGVVRFVSPTVYKMTGYLPEELVGQNFMTLFGDDINLLPQRVSMLIEQGMTQSEYQIQTKSGDIKWVRYSTKAVFENNILVGATGTLIDITDRKNIELELKRSESLYSSIITGSPDAITLADMEGRIVFASAVNNQMFGYESSFCLIDHYTFEFISKDDHLKAQSVLEMNARGIVTGVEEYKGLKADGSTFDIEVNTEIINDENGHPVNILLIVRDISAKKLLEEKLHNTEEQYRNLVENINEIIYEIDDKGIVKYVSPSIQQMGYQPEEMIGKSFLDFTGDKAGALYQNLVNIKKGEQITNEYEMYSKDGQSHWLRFSTKAVYDINGHFMGGAGTLVDVTERKRIQLALQKSEALYSSILNVSPYAMTIINFDGTIVFASPANYKIFGYDPSYDLTRHSVFDFVAPEDYDKAIQNSVRKLNGEDIGVIEYKGVRADSSFFDFEINSEFIMDANSTPVQLLLIIRDITNRKLLEQKLKKTEESYRNMVERINDVVFEVTTEGIIKYVSPAIKRVLGYTTEELTGKNFFSYMYPEDIPYLSSALADLENRDSSDLEYRYFMKDGSVRWVRSSSKPIIENGKMIGGIGVLIDVHERKLAEESLRMSELRYKSFFEGNTSIMILVDPETGEIKDANPAASIYYGWTKEEICRMNISEINVLTKGEIANEMQLAKNEERKHFYFKHLIANGEIHDVEVYSGPIVFNGHTLLYSIVHDITDRVKIENNLRISEEKYRSIFETVQDAYYEATIDGILLDISPAIEIISKGQFKRAELIGKSLVQFYVDPDTRTTFYNQMQKTGHVNDYELAFQNKDGSVMPVSISATLVCDSDGNPHKITGSMRDILERKLAEEEIKASEEKYRLLFSNNPQPMWIYDLETLVILEVNKSSIDQYGYTREEFLKLTIKDIRPVEDLPDLMIDVEKATQNKSVKGVWRHVWKNGDLRYVEISAQSIDFNGRKARHVLINDITDRVLTETEIKDKSILLTNLIVNLKEGILLEDSERKIILTNQLFCDMFGIPISPDILIGADCTDSAEQSKLLFKDPDKFITKIDQIFRNKKSVFNDELELADGRYFERDYIPTYVENTYSGHLWKYRDITERKLAEQALKNSDERFNQVVAQSQEVVWEVDAQGLYTYVSPMAMDVYGYSAEELVGKLHFYDICPIEERDMLIRVAFEIFEKKGDFQNLVNRVVKPDSTEIILLTNGIPMINDHGDLIGYRGIDANITEQKRAEEELIKFRTISDQANYGAFIASLDGTIQYVNECLTGMIGWQSSDLINKNILILQSEEHLARFSEIGHLIRTQGGFVSEELYYTRKDGTFFPTLMTAKVIFDKNQIAQYVSSTLIDISERKQVEENLLRLNRLRSVISNINHAIITEKRKDRLLEKVCDIAIVAGQFQMAWIGMVDDETKAVRPYIVDGFENGYLSQINPISVQGNLEERGPTASALIEGKLFVTNDIENDPVMSLWKDEALKRNYRSSIALPLRQFDEIYGSLNLYSTQINFFNSDEVNLLVEVVDNISNALEAIETEKERKHAEEELRKLSEAVEQCPVSIVITNLEGNIEYANPNACKTTGYSLEELMGQNPRVLRSGETSKSDYADLWHTIVSGTPWHGTFHNKKKNGEFYWESSTIAPVFNKTGEIINYVAIKEDITEQKFKDSKINRLSLAVTQSPVSVVITDLKGDIEFVNPAFEQTTGYTSEEVIGKSTRILKSEMNAEDIYADLWQTIIAGKVWENDWINKKKNGELYWEHISISPISDETGCIVSFLAVKQDISERKKAEQEIHELNENLEIRIQQRTEQLAETNNELLRAIEERKRLDEALIASEQSYQTVVENVNEVIFQTDAEGLWLFLNKAWEEITGFTVEESLGQLFVNYVHPDDRQKNMELFTPLINREKEYCRHEIRYLTKDGGFRWIEVFARLGVNDKDEITGTYGTLQDISERKLAEDFENEMLQLSPQLTGITANEINSALNLALSRIGKFLNADRAYIFEFDAGNDNMSNTYEWCNAGINAEIDNLQSIPCEILPMWMGELKNHRNIIIPSIKALPESWKAEKEILEPQGIQSLIVIPMLIEDRLIGFVGLDSVLVKRDYSVAEINILKVWSSMLASLLNNSRTEGLLEQTRQNFETFFNTIDDFLWVLDDAGNIIHINNTVINRLGYSAEELESNSILKVHPSDRRDEAGRIVGEMLQGVTEFCPVPVVTKTGQQIPVETRIKHGYWNGQPAIFGVSKDISKIQLSEQKFSTAFQSNSALMAISIFEGGQYLDVNNTFLEVLDYLREEVIGKTNAELDFFPDKNLRNEIVRSIDINGPVRELEAIIRRKDGELKTVLLSADAIYLGETKCLLTVSVDITERKLAEEEIRKARLEAEQANVAKSEFLSRMSHELRTPMNSILGFAQILEMGELNSGQMKGVSHILRSGKHLLSLINEVLDISRIEAGRLSISIEPIKVNGILEEMIDVLRPMANDNEVNMQLSGTDDNQLFVSFDRQSLKQVILNLLNNAIKYNKPGGSVFISTQQLPKTKDNKIFIRISISDTGLGISSEDIPKLFTPFERIGANKTRIEGTGLGLTVVKKLIDAMGGYIGVKSLLGKGSTFRIDLPKAESQLNTLPKLELLTDTNSDLVESKGTVLYIEDNASNIELIEQVLSIQRPEIQLFSNSDGSSAVRLATEYKPDLILLDLNLPDIHGSEVLDLLLNNKETKNIPVVIISADAMHKQVENLINAGAKKYLTKPLEVVDFLRVIDEFIQD